MLKDVGQVALVVGGEVQHDHERHPHLVREIAKEPPEGIDPAGRGPDADDGTVPFLLDPDDRGRGRGQ